MPTTIVESVVDKIRELKPAVVFAPHVETSTGIVLDDDYIAAVAKAVHEYGGHFVLDGIAAGFEWVDINVLSELAERSLTVTDPIRQLRRALHP